MKKAFLSIYCMILLTILPIAAVALEEASSAGSRATASEDKKDATFVTPQSYLSDKILKFFQKKSEEKKESTSARSTASGQGQGAGGGATIAGVVTDQPGRAPVVPTFNRGIAPKFPNRASRIFQLPVKPPAPVVPPAVTQARKQVKEIVRIDKEVKSVQMRSVREMQKSQEQGRKVRSVLTEIEKTKEEPKEKKEALAKEDLLAQEKLREAHEKTQLDTQMTNELEDVPVATDSESEENSQGDVTY